MMKKDKKHYVLLLILALLFACPGLLAYLLYTHPTWLRLSSLNKGTLLAVQEQIELFPPQARWRLLLWAPKTCDSACLEQMDTLARVRLALGRRLYQVDLLLVLGDKEQHLSKASLKSLEDKDISLKILPLSLGNNLKIFIANPQGHLLLAYAYDAKPDDIFHDLGRLLNENEKHHARPSSS